MKDKIEKRIKELQVIEQGLVAQVGAARLAIGELENLLKADKKEEVKKEVL